MYAATGEPKREMGGPGITAPPPGDDPVATYNFFNCF